MIYLISHENKFVKIGFTKNIHKRLSQLQTSSPVKLEVLHLIEGDVNLEKKLHLLFGNLVVSGEWFTFDDSILNYFKDKECLLWSEGFTPPEKNSLIGLIKTERLKNNLSLEALGEMYGCTAQSMREIEQREINGSLTINILHKIAKLFNKKLEYRFK